MSHDSSQATLRHKSNALHERVREFARVHLRTDLIVGPQRESFEELALDIARYQLEMSAGFSRLVGRKNGVLNSLEDIPILPTDAFRCTRVAMHPPEWDEVVYQTSGTTGVETGKHPVRDLKTKEELCLLQARESLFKEHSRGIIVALASPPQEPQTSSLTHMMELFMKRFDGRQLSPDPTGAPFDSRAPGRWLVGSHGIDIEGLCRAARLAIYRSEPLFILGTSFALLATLETLDDQQIRTPSRTYLMITGGFKGKSHQVSEDQLRARAVETFRTTPERIVGEYGMTELSSQLFEGKKRGYYLAPPWLRLQAIDPTTYKRVEPGTPGLAHFIDLANIDSCLSIVTQDLIRETNDGYQLQGRASRSPSRGCSLPYESLLISPSPLLSSRGSSL